MLLFADLSSGKDQEYFSEGLSVEVIKALGNFPELRVSGRASSFRFVGTHEDPQKVGKALNVATLLEGSVRTAGNRRRIDVELIRAADGSPLWSESYDREVSDIFGVQEEIARAVAGAMKVTLLGGKARSTKRTNSEAYNAYLQGSYFLRRNDKKSWERAVTRIRANGISRPRNRRRAAHFPCGPGYGPIAGRHMGRAEWAIRFYERHGFRLVPPAEKDRLLGAYWSIPLRQKETSVVLAYTR